MILMLGDITVLYFLFKSITLNPFFPKGAGGKESPQAISKNSLNTAGLSIVILDITVI
jgi:hypothetical protein